MTHTADLVERHRITIPVGSTGDNVAVARLHAEAYARARGFELSAVSISVIAAAGNGMPMVANGGYLGVAFDVVVGKGDIALDQRQPGVLDTWTWIAGMAEWWRRWLPGGRQGRVITRPEDGLASVTSIGNPLRHPSAEWLGGGALRGEGISPGPIPGAGPQSGTGQLPPWLRRIDPDFEDPDADEDDRP